MGRRALRFEAPRQLGFVDEPLDPPRHGQILVRTECSAISAGTEMLLYRGELPDDQAADSDSISHGLRFPTPYGYCAVGTVIDIGPGVDSHWKKRLVFGFEPHASHFVTRPEAVLEVPEGLNMEDAIFLPNAETAVNIVQDSLPILGERVLVLGQGIVGLLTAALLHEFPLDCLVTADRYALRRKASEGIGIAASLDATGADFRNRALGYTGDQQSGYDLVVELTGHPAALEEALVLAAYSGRIIVGSWYGSKKAPLGFGGKFHRSRVRLMSSQVSTIAPELSGRWSKARRFAVAWEALERIRPSRWITHSFPLESAADAYRILDESPDEAIQVVFRYP